MINILRIYFINLNSLFYGQILSVKQYRFYQKVIFWSHPIHYFLRGDCTREQSLKLSD